MNAIDIHSHGSTKKGHIFREQGEFELQQKTFGFKAAEWTKNEDEMAHDFRNAGVKVIIDPGFEGTDPVRKERNDYCGHLIKSYPDVIIGSWISLDPRTGLKGLREFERCLKDLKMTGLVLNAAMTGIAPSDKVYDPFYEMSVEAKAPLLITVGYTVEGAGRPGGKGYLLEYNHPRYVDEVAARFPYLTIIAGRQAWPWVDEMIAVLLHKANVWNELHGWSPKYFTPALKWDISHRLQDKILFGADYPLLSYERLFRDWESEGYSKEILEKVYYKNAQRLFGELGREISID